MVEVTGVTVLGSTVVYAGTVFVIIEIDGPVVDGTVEAEVVEFVLG